jgi:Flp pilus assembly protein TadD
MQLDPQSYQYPLTVAEALARQGRNSEAVAMAQQALALAPDDQKPVIEQFIAQLGG